MTVHISEEAQLYLSLATPQLQIIIYFVPRE